jgi:hypothetical protein
MMPDKTGETFGSEGHRVSALDWAALSDELDREGYAVVKDILRPSEVLAFGRLWSGKAGDFCDLSALELGRGQGRLLTGPLPVTLPLWQRALRAALMPLANRWEVLLGTGTLHGAHESLTPEQVRGTGEMGAMLTRLEAGDFHALHQNAAGLRFPFQAALLLSEHRHFSGGELVMTEQRPRMQSRPMVVPVEPGDIAILAAAHRPHRGSKGYYKVTLRHGVSRLRSGQRVGLEFLL